MLLLASPVLADDGRQPLPLQNEVPDDPPGTPAMPAPGAPAATKWRVGETIHVQVNVDDSGANIPGDAANEPSIAAHPSSPNSLVIAWRQFDTVASNFRQAGYAYSRDGGRTWTFPGSLTPGTFRSDPVLSVNNDGHIHLNSLEGNFTCDVFTSIDGGQTWSSPAYAQGGDKQWQIEDRTGGEGEAHIYEIWSEAAGCCGINTFSRSLNRGASFQTPLAVPERPRWGTIDVMPDGTVVTAGVSTAGDWVFSRSSNAQDARVVPTFETRTFDLGGDIAFGTGPNPGGLLGQAWIAADPSSGATASNLYVVCSVDPPGTDPLDVRFVRSTDGGDTWSSPIRINTDPSHPDAWQWFGTMSVSPDGRIDVVWNDTRNSLDERMSELYYRSSEDGGVTWSDEDRLSDVFDSHLGWPNQNKIGDYYHMVSDRVGAHLAWSATFNGEQDVYYTRIGSYDCNDNGIPDEDDIAMGSPDVDGDGIPDECDETILAVADLVPTVSAARVSPNPARTQARFTFTLDEGEAEAVVTVYSTTGRAVRTLRAAHAGTGTHEIRWDGRDARGREVAPGAYHYRLEVGDEVRTGSITIVR